MSPSNGKILGITAFFIVMALGVDNLPMAGDNKEPATPPLMVDLKGKEEKIDAKGDGLASPGKTDGKSNDEKKTQPLVPEERKESPTPAPGSMMGSPIPGGMMKSPPHGSMGMMEGPRFGPGRVEERSFPVDGRGYRGGLQPEGPGVVNGPPGWGGGPTGPRNEGNRFSGKTGGASGGTPNGTMEFAQLAPNIEAVERYLYEQRQRIRITTDQEKAWNAFAQAVMNQITTRIELMNTWRKSVTVDPMDRTELQLTAMEAMLKQRRALFQEFRALHESSTPEQKRMIEQLYLGFGD
ncbi:MAG: Spy/CpxP family protein refolding chaperone [Magnetococcales bacterium]|nr:Spy/CpxP family protein refolding chaperone [Magnetococcales bacterium]